MHEYYPPFIGLFVKIRAFVAKFFILFLPSVDPLKQIRLRAVELLVAFFVFVGEIDNKFDVRAMDTCAGHDLSTAASEDTL